MQKAGKQGPPLLALRAYRAGYFFSAFGFFT